MQSIMKKKSNNKKKKMRIKINKKTMKVKMRI